MSFLLLLCHCVVCVWHHWFLELFLIILPHKEMIRIMWCFYTTFSSSLCSLCYLRVPLCIFWCSSFDWLASQFLNILRLANCSKGFYSELNKFLRGNLWTTIITKKKDSAQMQAVLNALYSSKTNVNKAQSKLYEQHVNVIL